MANGRCDVHGGKTPRGDQWHVPQFHDPSTPRGAAKFGRKLRDRQKYADKRAKRLAAMTPEQLAKHEAWHRTHKPGAGVARRSEGDRVRHNAEIRLLLAGEVPGRSDSPEKTRLLAERAAVMAELARLEAMTFETDDDNEGIFG